MLHLSERITEKAWEPSNKAILFRMSGSIRQLLSHSSIRQLLSHSGIRQLLSRSGFSVFLTCIHYLWFLTLCKYMQHFSLSAWQRCECLLLQCCEKGAIHKWSVLLGVFACHVHLSVRMQQLVPHWTNFDAFWYLSFSRKSVEELQVSLKCDKNKGELYLKTFSHLWQYLAELFLKWEMYQTKFVTKIKTHILCSIIFFLKSCLLWDNVEKYCGAREASDDNIEAHCLLD